MNRRRYRYTPKAVKASPLLGGFICIASLLALMTLAVMAVWAAG